jgi:chemotaxis signal transduction protein/nucleoid-associated protein YgaU
MDASGMQTQHEKSLLLFRVGPFRFCVPATDVDAIIGMPSCRSIPKAPPSIQGVFPHRGRVATIINLRCKLGLENHRDATDGQLILSRISIGLAGFRVDEVMDITASMEKDIIELSALKQSTRFDQVLVLGDDILQCITFEQLFQADDAPHRPAPAPPPGHEEEKASPPVEEVEEVEETDIKTPEDSGKEDEDSDPKRSHRKENMPDEADAGNAATAASIFSGLTSKNAASAASRRPSTGMHSNMPPRQNRHPASYGKRTAARAISTRRHLSVPPAGNTFSGPDENQAPATKRWGLFTLWPAILAGVALALYFLWPDSPERYRTKPEADTAPYSTTAKSASEFSGARQHQEEARPAPSAVIMVPTEEDVVTNAVNATPPASEAAEDITADNVSSENEAPPPETESIPPDTGASRRFMTIETQDFTLTVEPGDAETGENTSEGDATSRLRTSREIPTPQAEKGYVHIVVKGDTLWDIAGKYLQDPLRYPQLAESSRIRDPDWIYPGDRIRIVMKSKPVGSYDEVP